MSSTPTPLLDLDKLRSFNASSSSRQSLSERSLNQKTPTSFVAPDMKQRAHLFDCFRALFDNSKLAAVRHPESKESAEGVSSRSSSAPTLTQLHSWGVFSPLPFTPSQLRFNGFCHFRMQELATTGSWATLSTVAPR